MTYEEWLKTNHFEEHVSQTVSVFIEEYWKHKNYAYIDENGRKSSSLSPKKIWEAGYQQALEDMEK